jgi:transporter family-2 protein
MNALLPILVSFLAGVTLTIQPLVNGRLSSALGGVLWAAGVSAALTSIVCFTIAATMLGTGGFTSFDRIPWWAWIGGLFGLPSLVGMMWAVPRVGAAPVMVVIILGQLITAVVIDWQGYSHAGAMVTPLRLLGVAVVALGVCIVMWKPA